MTLTARLTAGRIVRLQLGAFSKAHRVEVSEEGGHGLADRVRVEYEHGRHVRTACRLPAALAAGSALHSFLSLRGREE